MSVGIELRRVAIRPTDFSALLADWTKEKEVGGRLDEDGTGYAYFFLPGRSIRGFSLTRRRKGLRDQIELRLNVCSSSGDWEAAYSFLRFGHDRGFEVRSEDGEGMGYSDLLPGVAIESAIEQFASDVRVLQQMLLSNHELLLETPNFVVPVRRADIPNGPLDREILERIQHEFLQRATKYDAARPASLITTGSGDTMVVWAGEAMLTPAADYVVLSPLEFDAEKSIVLAFKNLLERSPAGFEKIREDPPLFYLPALLEDSDQWVELKREGVPFESFQFKKQ
jgi:hypothetical protein